MVELEVSSKSTLPKVKPLPLTLTLHESPLTVHYFEVMELILGRCFAGSHFSSLKYHIDELNEETYTYKYTLVEGDSLTDKLKKITYEVKFEPTAEGGSISKVTSKYYTKDDFVLKEDEIKAGKEKVLGMYKVVEAYLLQNPDAYA